MPVVRRLPWSLVSVVITASAAAVGACSNTPSGPSGTSRRRRRQYDVRRFSAVRTTQARGAGCLPTVRQDAQARANASAT